MIVYIVMESGYDFGICRGVFNTKKAAEEFTARQKELDRFADYIEVERWKIENLAEVRAKFKKRESTNSRR